MSVEIPYPGQYLWQILMLDSDLQLYQKIIELVCEILICVYWSTRDLVHQVLKCVVIPYPGQYLWQILMLDSDLQLYLKNN